MTQQSLNTLLKATQVPNESDWRNVSVVAGILGGVALFVSVIIGLSSPTQFYFSYLVSFMFYLSLSLGALFFVLLQFVTRAGWSVVVRRVAEMIMGALPLFLVLFLPIAFGMPHLYHWVHDGEAAADALLAWKSPYLNVSFFLTRAAVYLVTWSALALWYFRTSVAQDTSGSLELTARMQWWSGPALLGFAITLSFAAVDWIMTLDPHWYSTMFGVYYFSGSVVGIFAVLILFVSALQRYRLLVPMVTTEHFHDLGKLLFGFTVFWSYIAFSQYFLIWYANIPEETVWYAHRLEGSWGYLSMALAVGHFGLPFFYLMSRTIKRKKTLLALGALGMLVMHYVDLYWMIMPVFHPHGFHIAMLDISLLVGIGGVYVSTVTRLMSKAALVPIKDPRLSESLAFENV